MHCPASLVVLLAVLSISLAAVIRWEDDEKPTFCNDHDCPKYTVVSTNENYEVRDYETSYWVAIKMNATNFIENRMESKKCFFKLFDYISGANVDGEKMDMTAPVIKYRTADQVVMGFMIPFRLYGKAPAPTDPEVYLYTATDQTVYVKSYRGSGWEDDQTHRQLLKDMEDEMMADGIIMNKNGFYVTGYDGPRVAVPDRYHELWVSGTKAQ